MNIHPGSALPYGAHVTSKGVNFAVYAENCDQISLCLFTEKDLQKPIQEIVLDPMKNKTGHVWHLLVENLPNEFVYGYRIVKGTETMLLLDPYAKAIASHPLWVENSEDLKEYHPLGKVSQVHTFDWQNVKKPNVPNEDLIIYELHVRGFTKLAKDVKSPGTYQAIIDKIPYLLDLGVNAVELLPIHEFNETDVIAKNPETHKKLHNYFGYSTVNFFSPMNRYASDSKGDQAITEFKTVVRELHKNNIEVILDVVFNHTFEGNDKGPSLSFKGFNPRAYYLISGEGENDYMNFSGCGNTFNCNNPVTRELVLDALRYWVSEMKVDGFRFDLASVFNRAQDGSILGNSPLMEAISHDPILAGVKLIAEPWDCAIYQVGFFSNYHPRWSEWNGKYRDAVRKFIKGTPGTKKEFAEALCGSKAIYANAGSASASVNFITIHDGFTLKDLVSYNEKHNEVNGEENRDGSQSNESWNCGFEGETDDPVINEFRIKQMKNLMFALFFSQGIPMLQMGDEYGHTKFGNNNSWCQDNELNWFDWNKFEENQEIYQFIKKLIHFRKNNSFHNKNNFYDDKDIKWHGINPYEPEWDNDNGVIAFTLHNAFDESFSYIAFNASGNAHILNLPPLEDSKKWQWMINTANKNPDDFYDDSRFEDIEDNHVEVQPYSSIMLRVRSSATPLRLVERQEWEDSLPIDVNQVQNLVNIKDVLDIDIDIDTDKS